MYVPRKDAGYIGRRMLMMEQPEKRKRGRPKRRFMDAVREDMTAVEVTEEDAGERTEWRWNPLWRPLAAERRRHFLRANQCTLLWFYCYAVLSMGIHRAGLSRVSSC